MQQKGATAQLPAPGLVDSALRKLRPGGFCRVNEACPRPATLLTVNPILFASPWQTLALHVAPTAARAIQYCSALELRAPPSYSRRDTRPQPGG